MDFMSHTTDDENNKYGTGIVSGSDIFDTSVVGYGRDSLIPGNPGNDYMEKQKNLKGEIKMITPKEYFQGCASIFDTSVDKLLRQTKAHGNLDFNWNDPIEKMADIIIKNKRQFPMTFLDFAQKGQEGMHRMYVAGELFGWDKRFPCLIINWADPERERKHKQYLHDQEVYKYLKEAIKDVYKIKFVSWEDVVDELEYDLESLKFNLEDRHSIPNVVYDIEEKGNSVVVSLMDKYKITIEEDDIQWISQEEKDRLDKEFDDEINKKLDDLPDDISADDIIGHFLK